VPRAVGIASYEALLCDAPAKGRVATYSPLDFETPRVPLGAGPNVLTVRWTRRGRSNAGDTESGYQLRSVGRAASIKQELLAMAALRNAFGRYDMECRLSKLDFACMGRRAPKVKQAYHLRKPEHLHHPQHPGRLYYILCI
jgi:hypothetical protein